MTNPLGMSWIKFKFSLLQHVDILHCIKQTKLIQLRNCLHVSIFYMAAFYDQPTFVSELLNIINALAKHDAAYTALDEEIYSFIQHSIPSINFIYFLNVGV